jgi:hypothetical protein
LVRVRLKDFSNFPRESLPFLSILIPALFIVVFLQAFGLIYMRVILCYVSQSAKAGVVAGYVEASADEVKSLPTALHVSFQERELFK